MQLISFCIIWIIFLKIIECCKSNFESKTMRFFFKCFNVCLISVLFPVGDANFRAKDIGFRAQKKLLSRMANKSIAKVFIDDTTGSLLDNLYRLGRAQTGNKKEAEKVVKNIIKVGLAYFFRGRPRTYFRNYLKS